jgi:hypothetical protein
MRHELLFNLGILAERDQVAIAYTFEQHTILGAQGALTKLHLCQQILMVRAHELDVQSLQYPNNSNVTSI